MPDLLILDCRALVIACALVWLYLVKPQPKILVFVHIFNVRFVAELNELGSVQEQGVRLANLIIASLAKLGPGIDLVDFEEFGLRLDLPD